MTLLADLLICLRFFTRLPLPTTARETALGRQALLAAAPLAPVAGALVGGAAALGLVLLRAAGVPPTIAASLALAGQVALTGALHEDGLADCADGFGGGATVARKLDIMRDSRIGAFGTVAIGLSLLIRWSALAALAGQGAGTATLALVLAGALSRAAALLPAILLAPARDDGLGAQAAHPDWKRLALVAVVLTALAGLVAAPLRAAVASGLALLAGCGVCALAARQIGGQTGDVAGAAQQVAEAGVLIAFAALP